MESEVVRVGARSEVVRVGAWSEVVRVGAWRVKLLRWVHGE